MSSALRQWVLRLLGGGVTFGAVAVTVHDFVGTVFTVNGRSMSPTLNPPSTPLSEPDRVFANVWSVRANRYRRGDVVVLYNPVPGQGEVVRAAEPFGSSQRLIKRIIALPGDWVSHADNASHMTRVPAGHCWVEGDNPAVSIDSNTFGPVPLALITARVSAVVWPYQRMGLVRAQPRPDRVFTADAKPRASRTPTPVRVIPIVPDVADDAELAAAAAVVTASTAAVSSGPGAADATAALSVAVIKHADTAAGTAAVVDDTAIRVAVRDAVERHKQAQTQTQALASGSAAKPSAPASLPASSPASTSSSSSSSSASKDAKPDAPAPKPPAAGSGAGRSGGGGLVVTRDGKSISLRDRIQTIAPEDLPKS